MFYILDNTLLRLENAIASHLVTGHLPDVRSFPPCIGYRLWVEEIWINEPMLPQNWCVPILHCVFASTRAIRV